MKKYLLLLAIPLVLLSGCSNTPSPEQLLKQQAIAIIKDIPMPTAKFNTYTGKPVVWDKYYYLIDHYDKITGEPYIALVVKSDENNKPYQWWNPGSATPLLYQARYWLTLPNKNIHYFTLDDLKTYHDKLIWEQSTFQPDN